jgi:two-component system response regulator YesN
MSGLLIADDEAVVRSAILRILARGKLDLGTIVEARNGEEAISLARRMRPSIVLMDVKMPGLDGLEATRAIRAEHPSTRVIILSAYDEFSFAQEALKLGTVDYLLKPVRPTTLIEVLSRVQAQIRREERHLREMEKTHSRLKHTLPLAEARLVEDLINGTVGSREVVDRVLGYLGKTISWPAVLVVDVDDFSSAVKGMDSERLDHFCVLLTDIVRRAMPDPDHTLMGHIRQGVVVTIVSTDQRFTTVDEIRTLGHTIRFAVESSAPVTVTIGIGRRHAGLQSVHLSYEEAMRAQQYKLYLGRNSVIHIDDVRAMSPTGCSYPVELERDLLTHVRRGQRKLSRETLEKLADRLLDRPEEPPEVVRTRFKELMALVSRAVIDAGAPSSEILELSHRQMAALATLQTGEEIRTWALDSLAMLMSKIREAHHGKWEIERAVRYMCENFREPGLKLEDVAHAVHLSPSHLAHLFKERVGVSYVKYLTFLRVEEAKKLLRTTEMTVAAVAAAVGYEASYFFRVFRHHTGMTPTTYRRKSAQARR